MYVLNVTTPPSLLFTGGRLWDITSWRAAVLRDISCSAALLHAILCSAALRDTASRSAPSLRNFVGAVAANFERAAPRDMFSGSAAQLQIISGLAALRKMTSGCASLRNIILHRVGTSEDVFMLSRDV